MEDDPPAVLHRAVVPVVIMAATAAAMTAAASRPETYKRSELTSVAELFALDDEHFRLHFRVPRDLFNAILSDIRDKLETK